MILLTYSLFFLFQNLKDWLVEKLCKKSKVCVHVECVVSLDIFIIFFDCEYYRAPMVHRRQWVLFSLMIWPHPTVSTLRDKTLSFMDVLFNRSWRISTTPNTTKFFLIIFKLIQQPIMVILSCFAKKNQNLNSRKKSSVSYWKGRFAGVSALKCNFQ